MKSLTNSIGCNTFRVLVAAVSLAFSVAVSAQEPLHIGFAAEVERTVEGQIGEADFVTVQIDDDIFFNEIITTEPDARAVMSFRDGSSLEIGPNSALTIDEFVFNPVEGVKTQTVTALVGSFRFVSGMAMPNQTITINTPTATLGIRGSVVPFVVGSDGATAAVPTNGTTSFAAVNNPNSAINIATGETGVIVPGGAPATGPSVRSVGRQLVSSTRNIFGARVAPTVPTAVRQARDAVVNQAPVETQQGTQQQPSQTQLNARTAVINARQDQTMDSLGVDAVLTLNNAGVLTGTQNQAVVDTLDAQTAQLEAILQSARAEATVASETNHEQGTRTVITGLSQTGDAGAVTSATRNAAQADSNQASAAVGAAAANLPNLDANSMTNILQGALNGLQAGNSEVNGNVVGALTATAINNLNTGNRQTIGSQVANNVATNFAAQNPSEAANLASTLTSQLRGNTAGIARTVTQNLATQNPGQANAIRTAANRVAAVRALATSTGGVAQVQAIASRLSAGSGGPNATNVAAIARRALLDPATAASILRRVVVPTQTGHGIN